MIEQYVERVHTAPAVLDIGQGVGALAVYTRAELLGQEIEVSIKGNDEKRIHTAIHERKVNGRSIYAGLFLALPEGEYIIWVHPSCEVTITSGHVAEVNWRDIEVFVPSKSHRHPYGTYEQTSGGAARDVLPPRYRNGQAVSAAPMGTALMRYNDDGQVAWDEMWTSYCDLALAGGPSHRDTLLEPVSPDEVRAALEDYERVVAEIERGLRMVTGLPTVRSEKLGWVGLRCTDEEMALWMLRAIVVENVCVRREGNALFLPAGPTFQLEQEIKNVVTVIAKTHHYWTEHCLG
ncbi:MAG: hypothetical protein ACYDER_27810 [Ktedonobacteraceae bacterium]